MAVGQTQWVIDNVRMDDQLGALNDRGFAWVRGGFPTSDEAFDAAQALIDARCSADGSAALAVIGDFVIPPVDGQVSRDFQTLQFDFALPLDPKVDHDVAPLHRSVRSEPPSGCLGHHHQALAARRPC